MNNSSLLFLTKEGRAQSISTIKLCKSHTANETCNDYLSNKSIFTYLNCWKINKNKQTSPYSNHNKDNKNFEN